MIRPRPGSLYDGCYRVSIGIYCVLYLIAAPSEPTTVHEISESEMVIEECEGSELL